MELKGFIELHRLGNNQPVTIGLSSIEKFRPMTTPSGGYYTELIVATGNGPQEKLQVIESYDSVRGLIAAAQ